MAAKQVATKKPTGITFSRNANKINVSWKCGDSNYSDGQQFQYKFGNGKWISLSVTSGARSAVFTIDPNAFYPNPKKPKLPSVSVRIRGNRTKYTKKNKKYEPQWSGWATGTYKFAVADVPTLSATLQTLSNQTKFEWSLSAATTGNKLYSRTEWQSILVENCSVSDGSKLDWVNNEYFSTGTGSASGYQTITEDTALISGKSFTRWFRIRSQGMAGDSGWRYAKHVYASPYQPMILNTSAELTEAGGFLCTVEWDVTANDAKPIDQTTVQYTITTPAAGLTCPSGASWTDAGISADTKDSDKAVFSIDSQLGSDECLFIRVNTLHDTATTYGLPALAAVGNLSDPTGVSVSTNSSTHKATVTATNNSSVPDADLAIIYRPASNVDESFIVGIIEHGDTSAVVQCPDWGEETIGFGVYAFVGDATAITRGDGADSYEITEKMVSANTVWKGGTVPVAPSGVVATATDIVGTVQVLWNWDWADANGAELSWADHIDAWESTSEPSVYEISKMHASKWNVSDLETGVKWYFRVRLFSQNGEVKTYSPWSDITDNSTVDLSSSPNIPVLVLSDGVITTDGETTASWVYSTTDGTGQAYAEIAEVTVESGETVYTPIAHTESAQHITLNAEEMGWRAGETHSLAVRVVSASGKVSDSWSDTVPVIIAEPMVCSITDTSLVNMDIPVNPRSFEKADIVTFDTELPEDVTSLLADINPTQDLHGYDSPWVGGAGKNKVPKGADKSSNGLTFTVNNDGSVKITGTASATTFWGVQFTIPSGTYILNGCPPGGGNSSYVIDIRDAVGGSGISGISGDSGNGSTFTINSSLTAYLNIRVASGYAMPTGGLVFYPMIRVSTESADYAPYSNICPISGWGSVDIYDDPKYGGTIEWNQLRTDSYTSVTQDGITTSYDNTTHKFCIKNNSRTTNYNSGSTQGILHNGTITVGHKVLCLSDAPTGVGIIYMDGSSQRDVIRANEIKTMLYTNDNIRLRVLNDYDFVNAHPVGDETYFYLNIIDLTALYGEGNEPSTVAEFKELYYKDYYAYDSGTTTCVSAVNGDEYTKITQDFEIPLTETVQNSVPYTFKATGDVKGDRLSESIVGGTVVWNQLYVPQTTSNSYHGVTRSAVDENGKITITGTSTDTSWYGYLACAVPANHKLLFLMNDKTVTKGRIYRLRNWAASKNITDLDGDILTDTSDFTFRIAGSTTQGEEYNLSYIPQFFDLTQMFGSTIADYIYSLEQANAGAGVAWFKSLFPEDYYAYDGGSLQSVNASAHIMRDADDNVIGNYALDNSLTLRGIPKLDTNNVLYYDGDEYEYDGTVTRKYATRAYQSGDTTDGSTMVTDGTTTLYKLNSSTTETADPFEAIQKCSIYGTEEYETNTIVPVGHKTQYYTREQYGAVIDLKSGLMRVLYGIKDLGTGSWGNTTQGGTQVNAWTTCSAITSLVKKPTNNATVADIISSHYRATSANNNYLGVNGSSIAINTNGQIAIYDLSMTGYTGAQVQAALNGVQLVYPLANPIEIQLTPRQIQTLVGQNNVWANTGQIEVRIAEAVIEGNVLTELPLTVEVEGAGDGGITSIVVERAESYRMDRPDETNFDGFEGETIALANETGDVEVSFGIDDLLGRLDDGAKYRIVATTKDGLGQSAQDEIEFIVQWNHQALIPEATIEISEMVAFITPIAPLGALSGDTCDVYRLSADKPELILENAQFGTKYVDPYPTIGQFGGHRIVFKTEYGDYITANNIPAWTDYDEDDDDILESEYAIIDFDGEQILLNYNVDFGSQWNKDLKVTDYLDGSTQGDWNENVGREGTMSALLLTITDKEKIAAMGRLAAHKGMCHVRSKGGASFNCDIQVQKNEDHDKYGFWESYTMKITKLDAQELDGILYSDWYVEENEDELE